MIKVKHPLQDCNEAQEKFIFNCSPELVPYHELLFTVGNITYIYHNQAKEFKPTEQDYTEWLAGLPDTIRKGMQAKGFEGCKGVLSFTRYVMEKNDIGLDKFIKLNLEPEEYKRYLEYLK